ncbi:MAG: uroporphyrinogen decarboxylase family protein [Candidatus Bathyarchaeia archaeon]
MRRRVMTVYRGGEPDRIPWLIYDGLLPRGYFERRLRNMGLGLKVSAPVWRAEMPHVRVETRSLGNIVYTSFHTPVGSVSMKQRIGLQEGAGSSWIVEHPIKGLADFEVVEFIAEDTRYVPDYKPFLDAERNLGDDGIVFVWAGRSPIQELQIELMGYEMFAVALYRYPKEFERLLRALEKRADERYKIIAESPAEVVNGMDNINSVIVSPKLYEKYVMPFYSKQHRLLRKHDKILEDHMDGKLKALKDLVAKTDLDAVEAFTPPPMGDLPLKEAREAWDGKIVSLNIPESIFLESPSRVKEYVLSLLREAAPGDRFMLSITEDIPAGYREKGLLAATSVWRKHGRYPVKIYSETGGY